MGPSGASPPILRLASRGSPLARWQADRVAALLAALPGGPVCEIVLVQTTGDRALDVPIDQLGGLGAFVGEVQTAVLEGRADIAVHSAKDLPSVTPSGLLLAAVPERADPRDGLVGSRLDDLPPGARLATGSVRRRAQLAWLRPDLNFVELRGNMATRLAKASQEGAGVVAVAALERLGLAGQLTEILSTGTLLPQVAQGALAVECRADDRETRALLEAIDDRPAHRAVTAERAFLAELGGGCTLPVGALASPSGAGVGLGVGQGHAHGHRLGSDGGPMMGDGSVGGDGSVAGDGVLSLEGLLASRDGRIVLRRTASGNDPTELGRRLAGELLDHGGLSLDDWGPVDDRSPR